MEHFTAIFHTLLSIKLPFRLACPIQSILLSNMNVCEDIDAQDVLKPDANFKVSDGGEQ